MVKKGNCIVCGRAPKTIERPNGCAGCELPELEIAVVEELPEEVVEEVEESEEDLDAYLEELPVKELKKLLKDANLNTKGKKADLIARLIE